MANEPPREAHSSLSRFQIRTVDPVSEDTTPSDNSEPRVKTAVQQPPDVPGPGPRRGLFSLAPGGCCAAQGDRDRTFTVQPQEVCRGLQRPVKGLADVAGLRPFAEYSGRPRVCLCARNVLQQTKPQGSCTNAWDWRTFVRCVQL